MFLAGQTILMYWLWHKLTWEVRGQYLALKKELFELKRIPTQIDEQIPEETVYGELPKTLLEHESNLTIENLFPGVYDNDWDEMENIKANATRLVT